MLSEREILDKLYELPEHFNRHMKNKDYLPAKHCYDEAVLLAVFLKVPEEVRINLFGNRPYREDYEEEKDGLFREADVLKAYEHCIKHEEERLQELRERRAAFGKRERYRIWN